MKLTKKVLSLLTVCSMTASIAALPVRAETMRAFPHIYDFEDCTASGLKLGAKDESANPGVYANNDSVGLWNGYCNADGNIDFKKLDGVHNWVLHVYERNWNLDFQSNWYRGGIAFFNNSDKLLYSFAVKLGTNTRKKQFELKCSKDIVLGGFEADGENDFKFNLCNYISESEKEEKTQSSWQGISGGKWYYVNYLFDLPNNTISAVLLDENGEKLGDTLIGNMMPGADLASSPRFSVSSVSDGTQKDESNCYFDNFTSAIYNETAARIIKSNGTDEAIVKEDNAVLDLRFDQNVPGAISKDKITVKDMSGSDVDFNVLESDFGGVRLQLADKLNQNAEYVVSFDESVKTVFNQIIADYTFKTALVDKTRFYCDFDDTADGELDSTWNITSGSADTEFRANANTVIENNAMHITIPSEHADGWLKITKNFDASAADERIINFAIKTGKDKARYFEVGNKQIFRIKQDGGLYVPAGWFYNRTLNKWHYVTIKLNVKTGEYTARVTEEDGTSRWNAKTGTLAELPDNGIDSFSIRTTNDGGADQAEDLWIDTISISDYAEKADPISTSIDGNVVTLKYPAYFKKDNMMDSSHISVTKKVNGVDKAVDFTAETLVNGAKITLGELPQKGVDYKISFNGVTDWYNQSAADYEFTGTNEQFKVSAKQGEAEIKELKNIDTSKALDIAVEVNAGADTKQVNAFAALYDSENRLAAVKAAGNAISGNDTLNMSMTFDGITDLTGYSLKTLVWDGSNVPYIEAVPIEY